MLRPRVKITFTKADDSSVTFTFLKGFETVESYEQLTDTLTIVVPRKYQTMQGVDLFSGVNPVFKRGDKVKVECGYFPGIRTVFEGYIRAVSTNIPIQIDCEDGMFLLKQYTFNIPAKVPLITKSKRGKFLKRPKVDTTRLPSFKLNELLDLIIPDDVEYKTVDNINTGKWRISNATPCMILEELRNRGLYSYFKGPVLYVGFASDAQDTREIELVMEEQVINSNELFYRRAEEVAIKVRATSMNDQNERIEVTVGPDDGEQRDYYYYNVGRDTLTKYANERLNEERYTGYYGLIETFLEPYARHGDRVKLTSKKLPERDGTYLIKSVRRLVDVEIGGRQFLELGVRVGN